MYLLIAFIIFLVVAIFAIWVQRVRDWKETPHKEIAKREIRVHNKAGQNLPPVSLQRVRLRPLMSFDNGSKTERSTIEMQQSADYVTVFNKKGKKVDDSSFIDQSESMALHNQSDHSKRGTARDKSGYVSTYKQSNLNKKNPKKTSSKKVATETKRSPKVEHKVEKVLNVEVTPVQEPTVEPKVVEQAVEEKPV